VRQIQFSEFELDLELFTLRRDNFPVEIGQRPLDLLACLIQNHERVVDLESLRREVWNSAALSPSAIPTCIGELRKALGDNASSPNFIECIRGRGYRFIGEVKSVPRSKRAETEPFEELPFVGRKSEMKILRELLRSSIAEARGHLILIRGEAGIGKTRLLAEFLKTIPGTVPSYLARGATIEGTPAFWPWTKILREALAAQKGSNQELIENAQSLSTAFPEIQGSVECARNRPMSLDRFSILSRWVQTIRSISRGTPLVLAFEDIHRADFDSLSLLAWIAEELSFDPVIVIATHRPSPETNEIAQGLSEIAALPRCKNIDLTPLTADDISLMLDPLGPNRRELSEELELKTSGNAFYVTHLIRSQLETPWPSHPSPAGHSRSRQPPKSWALAIKSFSHFSKLPDVPGSSVKTVQISHSVTHFSEMPSIRRSIQPKDGKSTSVWLINSSSTMTPAPPSSQTT